MTADHLRRFAINHSLFPPTTLKRALHKLAFVQADPIRAPARAQDLTLRQRVRDYRAGDLERRYPSLGIAEDFFINYGFVTQSLQILMHPRSDIWHPWAAWPAESREQAQLLLDFVIARGAVHPREVDAHFAQGVVTNYWGGSSSATTHLLDSMHYRGLLRIARRERGIRIYTAHQHASELIDDALRQQRLDALVDTVVDIYAPVPAAGLALLVRRLRHAAPQWQDELPAALRRAKERLAQAHVEGTDWYWPRGKEKKSATLEPPEAVRFLAPFDPVVWDRKRFELLWGWDYRFEAYTPAAKRKRGYYALPLLWRDQVIGWGNLSVQEGKLAADLGYIKSAPRDRAFRRELAAELDRLRAFLGLEVLC